LPESTKLVGEKPATGANGKTVGGGSGNPKTVKRSTPYIVKKTRGNNLRKKGKKNGEEKRIRGQPRVPRKPATASTL